LLCSGVVTTGMHYRSLIFSTYLILTYELQCLWMSPCDRMLALLGTYQLLKEHAAAIFRVQFEYAGSLSMLVTILT